MKIGIIGAGFVGSATAFALIMKGIARKIVLIDSNKQKAMSEANDISHAAPFAYANKIKAGDYSDLSDAPIIIITAGANQQPGETRLDLIEKNTKIMQNIIPQILRYNSNPILLIASNPVDIMTQVALKVSNLPASSVIGSGTILDTSRFRTLLGYHLGISPQSVHANVLGEHGDSEVLIWSTASGGTMRIEDLAKELKRPFTPQIKAQIDDNVRNAAYKIIEGKGATYYGIAGGLCKICQSIISNEYAILTVSSYHQKIEGIENLCLSLPTVIGHRGIHNVIFPYFHEDEHLLLKKSCQILKEYGQKALSYL